jgi:hypothetical protein
MVERVHGVLGNLITKMSMGSPSKWDEFLPSATFILNARTHNVTGYTPFSLVYGFQPRLPGDIFPPCIFDTRDPDDISLLTSTELNRLGQNRALALQRSREQQDEYLRSREGQEAVTFSVGEYVKLKNFAKTKFQFRHNGPFIVDRIGANNYYYLMRANGDLLPHPYNGAHLLPWSGALSSTAEDTISAHPSSSAIVAENPTSSSREGGTVMTEHMTS